MFMVVDSKEPKMTQALCHFHTRYVYVFVHSSVFVHLGVAATMEVAG